jgi:hypothetical protein
MSLSGPAGRGFDSRHLHLSKQKALLTRVILFLEGFSGFMPVTEAGVYEKTSISETFSVELMIFFFFLDFFLDIFDRSLKGSVAVEP